MTAPTNGQVLSIYLSQGIADWAAQNSYFLQIFDNVSSLFKTYQSYYRCDTPQGEQNSFVVFPLNSDTVTEPCNENGQIGINLNFYLGKQRTQRGLMIYSTIESVRAQLLDNPVYIQTFLSQFYVPGLLMINGQNRLDYDKLNRQIKSGEGAITATLVLNYKINILLNQRALWKTGNDFYSPVTKIYHTIENIAVNINETITPPIVAYTVTPTLSYPGSGTLFLPDGYTGNGYLLENDGSVTQSPVIGTTTPAGSLQFQYVATVSSTYPSTGMLIISGEAVTGNAGILLGDDGVVHNVIYDASIWLSPIYNQIQQVIALVDVYPVGGILLTKIQAVTGNAGILFGSDGNIYNVTLP